MQVTSQLGDGSTFWFTVVLDKAEMQVDELRRVSPDMCPILVVASNTSTRHMLTGGGLHSSTSQLNMSHFLSLKLQSSSTSQLNLSRFSQ